MRRKDSLTIREAAVDSIRTRLAGCSDQGGGEVVGRGPSLKIEFTQFQLREPHTVHAEQSEEVWHMEGKTCTTIRKLMIAINGEEHATLTPTTPMVVIPMCKLPVAGLLSMEYSGNYGKLFKLTEHSLTLRLGVRGPGRCCVL